MSATEHITVVVKATLAAHASLSTSARDTVFPSAVLHALAVLTATGHLRPWEAFSGPPTLEAGVRAIQAITLGAITAAEAIPAPGVHSGSAIPVRR
jgi:hypothetical protein